MILGPQQRRALLAVHLATSIGWVGAAVAYIAVAVRVARTRDPDVVRAGWLAMEVVGWWAVVPLALGAWSTGVAIALLSRWGLIRHYWVSISLFGTTVLVAVLVMHMPDVSRRADVAARASTVELAAVGSDLVHSVIGLLILLGVLALNVYKPRGLTKYGWRRARDERVDRRSTRA